MFMSLFFLWISLTDATLISTINPQFNFSFPSFNLQSCNNGSLICMGSVTGQNGYLALTQSANSSSPFPQNQVGRVLFHQPAPAWPAVFSTLFTVRISPFPNSTNAGDGLAFIMAQDNRPSPPHSYGSYMGIMDKTTEGGVVGMIAVELDTYANEFDIDGNHIGIDTTSVINPVASKSLNTTGIDLKSGKDIKVQIDYNSFTKQFQISVAYEGNHPLISFLNHSIDLSSTVPNSVFVGFTASTGPYPESHQVLNWEFRSVPLPEIINRPGKEFDTKLVLVIVIPITGLLLLLLLVVVFTHVRGAMRKKRERIDIENRSRIAANMPVIFTYKQLSKATKKFSKENLLGTGGFGSVYKGAISSFPDPEFIAVKKISATSNQGEREYLAEICTIGRLRHKNIVQLQGWCHEGEQLLLVYEYMPNGSLDHYIGKIFLDWKTRFKILTGLASALVYLHEECGNPVVHRDIKPNNVMLDSHFNAHLGDFGLARLLQNDSSAVTTMLAGTPGYLAPEVSYTGKATPESDVYSFGMVVIEVVTGRRSKGVLDENSLVDYVWKLHERNAIVEGVERMVGMYDEEEAKRALAVGLACLHPDPNFRPKIRKVEQIFLNPNEALMDLPQSRPTCVFVPLCSSFSDSTTTDFGSKDINSLLHPSISMKERTDDVKSH